VGSDPKSGKGGLQGGLHSFKTGGSFGLVDAASWPGRPDRTGLGPRLLRTQSNPLGGGSEVQGGGADSALMLTHCGGRARIELGQGSELGLDLPGRMATVQGSEIETGSQDRRGLAELEAIRIFPFPDLLLMYQAILSDTS